MKLAVCLSVEIGVMKVPFTHTFLLHNEYNIKNTKIQKNVYFIANESKKNLAKTVKLCTILFYPSSRYLKQPENKFVNSPRKKIHQGFSSAEQFKNCFKISSIKRDENCKELITHTNFRPGNKGGGPE